MKMPPWFAVLMAFAMVLASTPTAEARLFDGLRQVRANRMARVESRMTSRAAAYESRTQARYAPAASFQYAAANPEPGVSFRTVQVPAETRVRKSCDKYGNCSTVVEVVRPATTRRVAYASTAAAYASPSGGSHGYSPMASAPPPSYASHGGQAARSPQGVVVAQPPTTKAKQTVSCECGPDCPCPCCPCKPKSAEVDEGFEFTEQACSSGFEFTERSTAQFAFTAVPDAKVAMR